MFFESYLKSCLGLLMRGNSMFYHYATANKNELLMYNSIFYITRELAEKC